MSNTNLQVPKTTALPLDIVRATETIPLDHQIL